MQKVYPNTRFYVYTVLGSKRKEKSQIRPTTLSNLAVELNTIVAVALVAFDVGRKGEKKGDKGLLLSFIGE